MECVWLMNKWSEEERNWETGFSWYVLEDLSR